jgi:hypothetical protein
MNLPFFFIRSLRDHCLFAAPDTAESHGKENARLLENWVFGIMLPSALILYKLTHGSYFYAILGGCFLPTLAIAQGTIGILKYRLYFGDAPLPLAPSHGVVKCLPAGNHPNHNEDSSSSSSTSVVSAQPLLLSSSDVRFQRIGSYPLAAACQCEPIHSPAFETTSENEHCCSHGRVGSAILPSSSSIQQEEEEEEEEEQLPPLRLLVVGDSLAVGVGQSRQCIPVMPEVIAKTLSQELGGREVYWTCHGAPGASTGWIVRELERGVKSVSSVEETGEETSSSSNSSGDHEWTEENQYSHCSDTDESSSDESIDDNALIIHRSRERRKLVQQSTQKTMTMWRERLAQHRLCFRPDALSAYDIVVVLTGSNDLKSACFPFLLSGEDAEFRRQAQARGGNYTQELRRLLNTFDNNVRMQLQNLRESMEAATETVIEAMEETMELIKSGSFDRLSVKRFIRRNSLGGDDDNEDNAESTNRKNFPLIVLPGLPVRALPIFRVCPLRWLAVPFVDTLDSHKRYLARSHPREVLFIPPPSIDDLSKYENCTGSIWRQRCRENTILNIRDISKRDCRRRANELRDYYDSRDKRVPTGVGLLRRDDGWFSRFLSRSPAPGTSLFSVDSIHPTHDGYDFWGRYIGNLIVEDMKQRAQP